MKIAVIDSGVNLKDELLLDQTIETIAMEQGRCQSCSTDDSGHGTDIVKIICGQTMAPHIVSIQVLNRDNKGSVDALCAAVNHCAETGVDLINLSLGLRNASSETIQKLKACCDAAVKKGVAIVSSNHNDGNTDLPSYPYAFDEVIGVSSSPGIEQKIKFDRQTNKIIFSDNIVSVPDRNRVILRKGNSFLAPIIAGLYTEFLKGTVDRSDIHRDFLSFMEHVQCNHTNLFFYRNKSQSYGQFHGKKVGYFYMKKTVNDIHLFNRLHQFATVRLFHMAEEIDQCSISGLDFLFFGEISKGEAIQCEPVLSKLINAAAKQGIHLVMMVPFMSIHQRLQVSEKYKIYVQSAYI
ncbi:S8 family serine peptidase [Paenibacillus sp. TH7-28]